MLAACACIACCAAITLLCTVFNGRIDTNGINIGNNIALYYIGGFVGSAMVMLAAMLAPPLGGLWRLLAENTLTVLALHACFCLICRIKESIN